MFLAREKIEQINFCCSFLFAKIGLNWTFCASKLKYFQIFRKKNRNQPKNVFWIRQKATLNQHCFNFVSFSVLLRAFQVRAGSEQKHFKICADKRWMSLRHQRGNVKILARLLTQSILLWRCYHLFFVAFAIKFLVHL